MYRSELYCTVLRCKSSSSRLVFYVDGQLAVIGVMEWLFFWFRFDPFRSLHLTAAAAA